MHEKASHELAFFKDLYFLLGDDINKCQRAQDLSRWIDKADRLLNPPAQRRDMSTHNDPDQRTPEEIAEQIELAIKHDGRFSGMTYEEGVRAALDWILSNTDDPPIDED
jgi:hypothetical protein